MRDVYIDTEGTTEPMTLDEMISYVGYKGEDSQVHQMLHNLARSTRFRLEQYCGRNFVEKTMVMITDTVRTRFALPFPPVNSITSIEVYDEDNQLKNTWTEGTEYVLLGGFHKWVRVENYSTGEYLKITYKSGYKSGGFELPRAVKHSILTQLKYDFEHRSGAGSTGDIMLINEARLLIEPYREYEI